MKVNDLYPIDSVLAINPSLIFNELVLKEDLNNFINSNNVNTLNQDYYLSHSGDKFISPFVEKLYDDGKSATEINSFVASIVYNRFGVKWKKIYDALMTEYNPLENYSMEEERTPDLSFEETQNEKSDIKTERETSATNSYKGFNANDPVVINKTDGNENVETSGAKLDNEVSKTTTHTGSETLTRSGNIGVTTSQQMLESEIKVRQYDFYKMIYNDIDSVLCLSVY